MDDQQAQAAVLGWQRTVLAAHQQLQDSLGSATGQLAGNAGGTGQGQGLLDTAEGALEGAVNGVASFGKAMIDNPGAVFELAGGAAVTALGGALEVGGVGLDATGIGALAGVPTNIAGIGAMATGGGMMADAAGRLATAASGVDQVGPMQVDWKYKGGNEPAATANKIDQQQTDSGNAHDKFLKNIAAKPPKDAPPLFRQKGKNK